MKRIILLVLIIVLVFSSASCASQQEGIWKIKVLDLPNEVKRDPVMMTGLKPKMVQEFSIRVAAFKIINPDGNPVREQRARKWIEKDQITGKIIGLPQGAWLQPEEEIIEIRTSADKLFTAEGKVRLTFNRKEIIKRKVAEFKINNQPLQAENL